MGCRCGHNVPDVEVHPRLVHPKRDCEYAVKARWWRKGLLTTCVWCGKLARCAPSGYGSGGYHWEKVQ